METTVKAAGGYGMVISGAGPTLLALTDAAHRDQVIASMAETWRGFGVNPTVCHLPIHYQGAQVLR